MSPSRLSLIAAISLAAFAVSLSAPVAAQDGESANNYALLVGVTRYSHAQMNEPQLEYPESDAKAVGEFLAARGYQVEYLLGKDATKQAIERKLAGLASKGNAESAVVLGMWGHGVEYAGSDEAMYCPYDARIRLAVDSKGNALFDKDGAKLIEPDPASLVGMSKLLDALRVCGAGSKLLLADCCRNSPNRPKGRAFGSAVKLTDLPADTAALFACSQFEQAFEHRDWGHGAFTKCLLENLNRMQPEGAGVLGIVAPLRRDVAALVGAQSAGRDKQTVALVNNGIPDLRLHAAVSKDDPLPDSLKTSASYSIGVSIGKNLKADQKALDLPTVTEGMTDYLSGKPLRLSDETLTRVLTEFNRAMVSSESGDADSAQPVSADLKTDASYAIGVSIGKNLQQDRGSLSLTDVVQGLEDLLGEEKLRLTDQQMVKAMSEFNDALKANELERRKPELERNKQEESEFLLANLSQPGVKGTESGLQYKSLREGSGPTPKATDQVNVHYHGTFLDGTVFDSSVQRGDPIDLPIPNVIDGWAEALQMMKVGSKWKVWIPSKLAYGDAPQDGSPIPPGKLLTFEIELLKVLPAAE